jgi:hypothetical protein
MAREAEAAHENACARPVEKVTAGFPMSAAMARFWRQNILAPKCQLRFSQLVNFRRKPTFKSQLTIWERLVEKVAKYRPKMTLPKNLIFSETQGGYSQNI